jgi:uroporphyrinogen III methyltransferase/synthase
MGAGAGKVFLVGAGPGDPGLITLKGKRIVESADAIVYDYLASDELLRHCRPEAERIYVGKQGGAHSLSQGEINDLLVRKAREGLTVARLKGGDPFVFGRGGEEAETLESAGVPYEVVPGVSSAVAAPAYAGIPVTHRRYASSVAFVTGHEDADKDDSSIRWDHLARGVDTLVFLMGVKHLNDITGRLISCGRDPETPAALIRWGTTSRQRTLTAPLREIAAEARRTDMGPPAVLVVGEVVRLRGRLAWFEAAPLFGRKVMVTRTREQASELAERLRALGAEPVEFPTIAVREPEDWGELDRALNRLEEYHWVVFTSPNGVRFFLKRLQHLGGDIRDLKGIRIAAIGPGTAQAVTQRGVRVDLVPAEFKAEGLADAFDSQEVEGRNFLLPRAAQARDVLPERLRAMGARADVVAAYRTVVPEGVSGEARALLQERQVDAVTFTSSSTVSHFLEMLGRDEAVRLLRTVRVACIGPITAKTAMDAGLSPDVVANPYTIDGLVDALVRELGARPNVTT